MMGCQYIGGEMPNFGLKREMHTTGFMRPITGHFRTVTLGALKGYELDFIRYGGILRCKACTLIGHLLHWVTPPST